MTTTILPTRNTEWGFYGTLARSDNDPAIDAAVAWTLASQAIAKATRASAEGVRDFLDSRYGRHFADDVANSLAAGLSLKAAIEAATRRWMAWTISGRTERQTGIPRGLPYLTGFVAHCEIAAEAEA